MSDANLDLLLRAFALLAILTAGVMLIEAARKGVESSGMPYVVKEAQADEARQRAASFRERTFWVGVILIAIAVLAIVLLPLTRSNATVRVARAGQGSESQTASVDLADSTPPKPLPYASAAVVEGKVDTSISPSGNFATTKRDQNSANAGVGGRESGDLKGEVELGPGTGSSQGNDRLRRDQQRDNDYPIDSSPPAVCTARSDAPIASPGCRCPRPSVAEVKWPKKRASRGRKAGGPTVCSASK